MSNAPASAAMYAVLLIDLAVMSACVTTCTAPQVIDRPGANVAGTVGVHVPSTAFGSVTTTFVSVTFPVFVAVNVKSRVWPTAEYGGSVVLFTTVIPGPDGAVTVAEPVSVTGGPVGGVPDTVAVFTIAPASTSACVTV